VRVTLENTKKLPNYIRARERAGAYATRTRTRVNIEVIFMQAIDGFHTRERERERRAFIMTKKSFTHECAEALAVVVAAEEGISCG
jgi:hypothetical protein